MDNQIPQKTKRRAFTVSWNKKKLEFFEKTDKRVSNCKCQIEN